MSRYLRTSCAISALLTASFAVSASAFAQPIQLPPITVTDSARRPAPAQTPPAEATAARAQGSLTILTAEQAAKEINNTPGAVAVVPAEAFKDQRATTVKDMLDFVPGVWAQPKWGEDTRLSIRGSGLSRGFHGRSLQLYMDGIPINTADGYFDFQEIDPSAYRYVEVYKGANALRFGANSLGGAINFVTPSGRDANLIAASVDAGSFGYKRVQSSSGAAVGAFDYFVTGSLQREEGFRDHSDGNSMRGFGNFGYKLTPNIETRFYFNGNAIEQHIPGSVTKQSALTTPKTAAAANLRLDYQRNINSTRIANKTAIDLGPTRIEFGAFSVDRHLMHPIFQWLDYSYEDYGVFGRVTDERVIGAFKNRFVAGLNIHNGSIDNRQFANGVNATKGALLSSSIDKSKNLSAYVENSFYFLPSVALVTGTQLLDATRERRDRFPAAPDISGRNDFNIWSPKYGLLWDVDPTAQVFANISRSAEVPSFGENNANTKFNLVAQTATTYEIGTRGQRPDYSWDFAIYRANIDNELQCLTNPAITGSCNVVNANKTIHQGVEAGVGAALLKSLFVRGDAPDRLWLNVAYTYSDFRFDNDATYGNNTIPGAPPHYLRGELLYKHPSGVSFGPNIEWVPDSYYVDNRNSLTTEPYTLWGLKAVYDDGKNFSAYIEGRNLSDRKYISSVTVAEVANSASALFEPGNGRAYYAGSEIQMVKALSYKTNRRTIMTTLSRTLVASGLAAFAMTATAFAHISLETREAKAGGSYKAVLKLPHGCDGSPVVKLHVEIPEGVIAVKPMPKPGWQIETKRGAYPKAYPYYHGVQLTEGVKEIVWTGKLLDEHYDEFVFNSTLASDLKAGAIYFPVTQFCEKGEIAWTEIPAPGKDRHALVSPAPALVILAQAASAEAGKTFKAGGISVQAPWSRATPGGAQVAGGYMKITNNGKEPDRLTGGSFPNAARFEIHEMKTEAGVMTMRPLPKGLEIKPGETVELKPGGYHAMFMGLKQGLKEGETVKGTLVFEKAGTLNVEYSVGPIGGGGAPAAGGGHKHH